jgi:hypothetical protein
MPAQRQTLVRQVDDRVRQEQESRVRAVRVLAVRAETQPAALAQRAALLRVPVVRRVRSVQREVQVSAATRGQARREILRVARVPVVREILRSGVRAMARQAALALRVRLNLPLEAEDAAGATEARAAKPAKEAKARPANRRLKPVRAARTRALPNP